MKKLQCMSERSVSDLSITILSGQQRLRQGVLVSGRGGRGDRGGRGGGRGRADFKPKMRIDAGASGTGQNKKQTFDD